MSTEHWPLIDMVLSEALTGEVRFGVLGAGLRTIYTWLQGLSRPEDINDVDEDGTTVLSLCITSASLRGRTQMTDYLTAVRWLLKRGADVTIADQHGWTPLHHACNGPLEFGRHVIPQLLAAGADIDAKSTANDFYISGMTPLAICVDQFRLSAIRSSPTVEERIAGTGSYVINQSVMDEKVARNALAYVTTLIRYGASIGNCWGGHHAETWMCALEDRRAPHGDVLDDPEEHFIATPEAGVLNENNYWLACKALIKEVRVAPRKTILTLRSLAIKGRAKTADPILNFVVHGLPDGVAWKVLSFWRVERKRIVPSWNYADIGAGDTPAMAALTTQLEISKNQAHLRGVRDADSKMLKHLCHAIELLNASDSSTTQDRPRETISDDQLRSLAEASRQRRIAGSQLQRRIVRGQDRREGPA